MLSIIFSAFFLGFISSIVATGPVTFLILKEALLGKYKRSIGIMLGSVFMEAVYCTFSLTLVGLILQYIEKLKIVSEAISILVFLIIGASLLAMNPAYAPPKSRRKWSKVEHAKSFLTGFILVAMNPTIILTWAGASAALISLGIIALSTLQQIIAFVISATLGILAGGFALILLVKTFRVKLSEKFIQWALRILGIILIIIAIFLASRLISS